MIKLSQIYHKVDGGKGRTMEYIAYYEMLYNWLNVTLTKSAKSIIEENK